MKVTLSEKNAVVFLFVLVFIIFSFAHEDTKKMEKGYIGLRSYTINKVALMQKESINSLPRSSADYSE